MSDTELAGVICSRICHDLVNPTGAIINGIDLIRDLGSTNSSEELAMIEQSAKRAAAILKFHRLAFGRLGDPTLTIGLGELRERVEGILAGPRLEIGWVGEQGPPMPVPTARLTCLMLLAVRAMLGLAGALRIVLPAEGGLPVAVFGQGPGAAATDDQRRWLAGEPGPLPEPRNAEFALIASAAADAGARIELVTGAGQLALRALPA